MIFSDEHVELLRDYDFYKKGVLDELNKGLLTVKAWGDYQEKVPFVSFVVTTYNRPNYLKIALESIIRQSFHDYEIIVVDNECSDFCVDTETQKLIKSFNNPKIVYFRNIHPMFARMDRGASLARGEWLCFCHDDDLLSSNHLEIMTSIVKAHPEINFLSCDYRAFDDSKFNMIKVNDYISNNRHDGYCRKTSREEGVFFNQGPWTGALIKRQLYFEMGGVPSIETGCSDQIMCNKFIYWYSGYYRINVPLYFYRISNTQISSNKDHWFNTYISDFFFSKYALSKVDFIPKLNRDLLCFAFVLESMKCTEKLWGISFDLNQYAKKCGIDMRDIALDKMSIYVEKWKDFLKQIREENERKRFDIYLEKAAIEPYQ